MNSPNTSPPRQSTSTSTPPASQIPASSSAPAARCGYRAFFYGNASIANSTSRTFIGRSSARSTSCARFGRSSRESDALGSKAGDPSDRRSPQGAHSSGAGGLLPQGGPPLG